MHAVAPKQGSPIMTKHSSDIVYFVTESVNTFYKLCQESLEVQYTKDRCTCRGEMEKGKIMKRESIHFFKYNRRANNNWTTTPDIILTVL